ncbi:MAG TPA: 2'-5' RNA ligase family protein [Acidobacteriaceae bacterium]|jgi:2'-5' RNA ligase|nr:2'-5' RNA ligase family protein [Acidobacteriaceae bacterium]
MNEALAATRVLTLALDAASQERFEELRQAHYPAALNRIGAHLTLFHTLPENEEVRGALTREAEALGSFAVPVAGVMSLGRGVALSLESAELLGLHGRLATAFARHLSRQDQQGFRPHVVVQNKVSGGEAKALLDELRAVFVPWEAEAVGLDWWDYLGGPWRLRERFAFKRRGN